MLSLLSKFPVWAVNQIIKNNQKQKIISNIVIHEGGIVLTIDDEIHHMKYQGGGKWMMNYEIFTDEELRSWVYRDTPEITIEPSILEKTFIDNHRLINEHDRFLDCYVSYNVSFFDGTSYAPRSKIIVYKNESICTSQIETVGLNMYRELLSHGMDNLVGEWMLLYPHQSLEYSTSLASVENDIQEKISKEHVMEAPTHGY